MVYRLYIAPTIRSLQAKALPKDASIEEQWLVKYSRPTRIAFVGVWDTVGSMGVPRGSIEAKVHRYRFLDTHLRLDNENAFHALALDEHREDFEPTFWTRTVKAGEEGAPARAIDKVEQRGSSVLTRTSAAGTRAIRCRSVLWFGSWTKPPVWDSSSGIGS